MRAGDRPHGLCRGLVIEQYAAAAIDLEVDKPRSKHGAIRQTSLRPIMRNLAPCRQSMDTAAALDQDRGMVMPAAAIENPFAENGMRAMPGNFIALRCHRCLRQLGGLDGTLPPI